MRYFLLSLAFCLLVNAEVSAQSDDRDQWANDPTSAASGAYQAKRSLQSLGSNDMSSWTVPARTQSGAWTQQRVYSKRNFTIQPPQRRVNRSTQQKAAKKAQRDADHSAWLEQRNAQIEAAKEAQRNRDRIRREREAAENAADRQAGYTRHINQTAGYYRSQQARDQYMATEAARRIDEQYTTARIATPPSTNTSKVVTMSHDDLADLLDPPSNPTVVYVELPLQRSGSFSEAGAAPLSITDNRRIDKLQAQKWRWAMQEENLLTINHSCRDSLPAEPILLLSHDEFSVDSTSFFVLPAYGLVMPVGDSLMLLKDRSLSTVAWQDGRSYPFALACGDRLIGRTSDALYEITDQPTAPFLQFDTDAFALFSNDKNSLYALFSYDDLSSIFKINLETKHYQEIARLPEYVWKVEANGEKCFILIDNAIYWLNEEGEPHLFYRSEESINDLVFSPWGVLMATDKEIVRIVSGSKTESFYPYGAYRVWIDGNEIYLLDMEENVLWIENGADYIL